MTLGNVGSLLRDAFNEWSEDKAPQLAAALAYYAALSIAPLLVILLAVAAMAFGEGAARGGIENQVQSLVGGEGAKALEDMIKNANEPKAATVATLLSVITLLFGAAGVFGQLQSSLNEIWDVQPKPGRGILGFLRDRFVSFAMVAGVAFLLLASLVISAALASLGTVLDRLPEALHWLAEGLNVAVSIVVITLLFAMMYRYLPDVTISWRDVWLGAAITAVLFTVGKFAVGMYLGASAVGSAYGVAGSFVVLLVWLYYSALIFFFGAEITQVYANRYGKRIQPAENAEPATLKRA